MNTSSDAGRGIPAFAGMTVETRTTGTTMKTRTTAATGTTMKNRDYGSHGNDDENKDYGRGVCEL